ncbi:MAG: DUF3718 domain-containing protein [Gammaproteobacteria bacterium]|nr:DUF3718 domain-containing protein [Gammaproteobacteria bacterium]
MKLIYALTLTLGLATSAFAAQKQVNSDMLIAGETAYAQLCMAAMESKQAVNKKARELGISRQKRDKVVCNDMSLTEFAASYKANQYQRIATVE